MFKQPLAVLTVGLAVVTPAVADYSFEVGGAYGQGEIDLGFDSFDTDTYGLYGSYFLEPVDTSKGPVAEAAFLDRASSITLAGSRTELETNFGDVDLDSYGVDGRWVFKGSGWLLELGYRYDDFADEDVDTFTAGVGKYIAENTTLILDYGNVDSDLGAGSDTWGLEVEHLIGLSKGGIKVEASYSYVDNDNLDNADIWAVAGTYYFNKYFGIGASYELEDSDDIEDDRWQFYADWFITKKVALSLVYNDTSDDVSKADTDAVTFAIRTKF